MLSNSAPLSVTAFQRIKSNPAIAQSVPGQNNIAWIKDKSIHQPQKHRKSKRQSVRDFRLPPRRRWELGSSGFLRSE